MLKRLLYLIVVCLCAGCQPTTTDSDPVPGSREKVSVPIKYGNQPQQTSTEQVPLKIEVKEELKKEKKADCSFKDGIHPAAVGYYNPDTGHTATYDLKVHIVKCSVVRIDFPNGGWLDEDHIPATAIDSHGRAKLTDDKGRKWEVAVSPHNK